MARLALQEDAVESFLQLVDKAWTLHVRGHTRECEHLVWIKGVLLQKRGDHDDARAVFESLASKASALYVSFGLYELGLYGEAYCCLKDMSLTQTSGVLVLAQGSRCLMSLRDVSGEARAVYRRLEVFAQDKYFRSQHLSPLELKFVKQVTSRLSAFLITYPFRYTRDY